MGAAGGELLSGEEANLKMRLLVQELVEEVKNVRHELHRLRKALEVIASHGSGTSFTE